MEDNNKKSESEYSSVDELIEKQSNRMKYIRDVLQLVYDQSHLQKDIMRAGALVTQIRNNLRLAQEERETAGELVEQMDELCKEGSNLLMRMEHMENNLPSKYNRIHSIEEESDKENILTQQQENKSTTPLPTRRHLDFIENTTPAVKPYVVKEIQYLTQSEFNKIPGYMKGRISYDTVNAFIDKLNKCIADKYVLLHTVRSAIKKRSDVDKVSVYKRQECHSTKGKRFITQDDLKATMGGKLDKHTLNMIPMLRHTSRVQECRDNGMLRYVAITEVPH